MEEIAASRAAAGLTPLMLEGAAEMYRWVATTAPGHPGRHAAFDHGFLEGAYFAARRFVFAQQREETLGDFAPHPGARLIGAAPGDGADGAGRPAGLPDDPPQPGDTRPPGPSP